MEMLCTQVVLKTLSIALRAAVVLRFFSALKSIEINYYEIQDAVKS
jgi:hypothetical protein